ncbi:MAG: metal ABC transporter ATP-binding protein [Treponema sp.]|nr:metal ABC transporter ATP-binding protein [Treponema sp.]
MSDTMLVSCRDASFGYDGHIIARGLNFTIQTGDFLCITGENGSGKTTLLRGLLRLLTPMEGNIIFSPALGQTGIGYLSQEAIQKKDFPAGVFEIALSGNLGKMGLRPFYTPAEKHHAEERLRQLGIADLKNRCFRELSGGQQRRVLLARSLCAAQKLLVLDEPFAGLDPLISAELYLLLKKIHCEMGMTIIMVSHDIEVADYATHALHLQKKQLFFGSMEAYRQSEIGRNFFAKPGDNND